MGKRILGLILIVLGGLFTLDSMHFISLSWNLLWPLFLLVPGIAFHVGFFAAPHKNAGLLVPGGILTTYGVLFLAMEIFGWGLMTVLWPVFILGVALGLLELYLFGPKEPGLLIPVGILSLVGFSFLAINVLNIGGGTLIGIVLIAIGGLVLLNGKKQVK